METIAVLEGRATALSAPLLEAEDLAKARAVNQKMRDLLEDFDPIEFTQLNKAFHRVLFGKCPNARLVQLLFDEWENLEYFRVSTFRYVPQRAQDSVEEHERLVALIEAKADKFYIEAQARNHRLETSTSYRQRLNAENTADKDN
jgi:DNA-binding GntR family transcriptional regulator